MKQEQTKTTSAPRKKKAARACIHCQKAHLTCDDSRPCQRCIKRNLSTTCTDGARKKAKYLQDIDEPVNTPTTAYSPQTSVSTPMSSFTQGETSDFQAQNFMSTDAQSILNAASNNALLPIENYNYGFGSNATNLEYSILSNMLGSPLVDAASTSTPNVQQNTLNNIWAPSPIVDNVNILRGDPSFLSNHNTTQLMSNASATNAFINRNNSVSNSPGNNNNNNGNTTPKGSSVASVASSSMDTSQISASGISTLSAYGDGAVVAKVASPITATTGPAVKRRNQIITPEMAYASATKPFSYAEGYHYLINYVKTRMSREDLMRISRALALFRPSVLASMMNLTEDDLIFTEKCLQRTLLEYEKLISYSGTPTVVWRRTGEIALVGKEFSLLTQWSRDMLLNKKTYIYELMSNPSAVEYWEKYALHAFDNTDSAVYSTCILMSPTKRVVPCTFCFTIKRDIFDLPSVIVGNFLPILS
ncbi:Transcriptional regulator of nonfermentable carbon utilization [Rhizopus azygosporus]|uniref:Transcriptional regulator of nonfermentable carbon utilization n=1 Tax=Rhizopus azygosporus TaxID=86630 RepID=A0A367KHJ3_RHIAZ|nr:Transcriptional regulator of nonfermentable carbon utilization [Rhizopus azygosporus]